MVFKEHKKFCLGFMMGLLIQGRNPFGQGGTSNFLFLRLKVWR